MKKLGCLLLVLFVGIVNSTVYYQGSGGNDSADGLTWANRWLTPGPHIGVMVADDTIYTSGISTATTIRCIASTPATSYSTGLSIIGCDTNGIELTGNNRAPIVCTEAVDTLFLIDLTADYLTLKNLEFDGGNFANVCVGTPNADGVLATQIVNCRIHHADVAGIMMRSNNICYVMETQVDSCPTGLGTLTITRTSYSLRNCRVFGCSVSGIEFGGGESSPSTTISKCELYRNGNAIKSTNNVKSILIMDNTSIYNNTTALNLHSTTYISAVDNCFSTNTTAINANGGNIKNYHMHHNNYHNNGTIITINSNIPPGYGNTVSNPNFTSVVAGSENLIPQLPSSLIDSGSVIVGY